jgi:hypothetical protein
MKRKAGETAGAYLNVDLEVRSRSDISGLVRALCPPLFNLHSGTVDGAHFASFEAPGCGLAPDDAIAAMVKAVRGLPRAARAVWNQADDRLFDIGVEQAKSTRPFTLPLQRSTLAAVVKLDAHVAFTLYGLPTRPRRPKLPKKPLETDGASRRR